MTCQKQFGGKFLGSLLLGVSFASAIAFTPLIAKGLPASPVENNPIPKKAFVDAFGEKPTNTPSNVIYPLDFEADVLKGEDNMCKVQGKPRKILMDFDMSQN